MTRLHTERDFLKWLRDSRRGAEASYWRGASLASARVRDRQLDAVATQVLLASSSGELVAYQSRKGEDDYDYRVRRA